MPRLNSFPPLFCPARNEPLVREGDRLVSRSGKIYPVVFDVPVIVDGVEIHRQNHSLSEAAINHLIEALSSQYSNPSEISATLRENINEVFGIRFKFQEDWLQVEADQFVYRIAASHEGLREELPVDRNASLPRKVRTDDEHRVALKKLFDIHHAPTDTAISVNLRVRNSGETLLSSEGTNPIFISYHWIDGEGREHEGIRTPLLIDLEPGREISQPVYMLTPSEPGTYKLHVSPIHENIRWMRDAAVKFNVDIGSRGSTLTSPDWKHTTDLHDYQEDHNVATRLIIEWSARHLSSRDIRMVEIGGNMNPIVGLFDAAEKINIDIDTYGMLLGKLVRRNSDSNVTYVVADGMNLPLQPQWADMIMLFAAFHHFPDPLGFLRHLAKFLTKDGLLCLMCEPIGHVHRDTQPEGFRNELINGVNEQSFELWEYAQMFDGAGLEVIDCQVDVGSLKVALRRKQTASKLSA